VSVLARDPLFLNIWPNTLGLFRFTNMVSRKDQPMILLGLNQVEKAITSTMPRNRSAKSMVNRPRKNGRKRQGPARRGVATGSSNPPQMESNLKLTHKFRFQASAAEANFAITDSSVIGALGGICTVTNSTVTNFAQSFRIKSLEMWAPPASQGAAATVSVEWFGFGNSPNIEHSDTTLSVSRNAHIKSAPPSSSLASFWQKGTSTNLFILNFGTNTIIDLIVEIMMADQETALETTSVSAGVLGHIYYLALDQELGSHILVPVSLNTTS
jgi:hypothetical protein